MPHLPSTKTREKAQEAAAASGSGDTQSHSATITSAVAADPRLPPSKAAKRLFPSPPAWQRAILRVKIKEQLEEGRGKHWVWHKGAVHDNNLEPDDDELAAIRAKFGYKTEEEGGPSRLYMMMLADACLPLPRYPLSGVVSPPLLATTGIVPFSIFSTGPDIIGHYYDCIVAAKREVILLTNYWQLGKNVDRISDALKELEKRHSERRKAAWKAEKGGGDEVKLPKPTLEDKIIVKIMWDRGPRTLADLFRLRKPVPPGMWKENGLPEEKEVPHLSIEILNYHRPLMGTFHAKLLLVDRQVALINSNNIQDRPNIEACTRLEGDIVNSVYDHALISWGNRLNPPLPCLGTPAPREPPATAFSSGEDSTLPALSDEKMREIATSARKQLSDEDEETEVMTPIARRMSFAEVVDDVLMRKHVEGPGSPSRDSAEPRTEAENEQLARKAGATWARKVLGERFQVREGQAAAAASPSTHRSFAELVEAEMKRRGIQPGYWAEGALDVFGLGPSSSRNVADEVRRSRAAKGQPKDAASRGINVPQAVSEEVHAAAEGRTADDEFVAGAVHGTDSPDPLSTSFVGTGETAVDSVDSDPSTSAAGASAATTAAASGDVSKPAGLKVMTGESMAPTEAQEADKAEAAQTNGDAQAATPPSGSITPSAPAKRRPGMTQASSASSFSSRERYAGVINPAADPNDTSAVSNEDGAPGAEAFRRHRRRTLSIQSKASASERLAQITKSLDFANLSTVQGPITAEQLAKMEATLEAKKTDELLDFNPFLFHQPHEPVPMALVNRRPHGTPGHNDIRNAQDAAWLAGFRYAKKHIFIQTPTLNATPIKHAVLHACRRHVRVELWLGLGFNQRAESFWFQGGPNDLVTSRLYRQLRREGKGDEKYLEIYWYTGKDMTRPLNAARKQRNCHVKYAEFDGQVAIIGSGNQDTQSWFHSQEINVMVDSRQIVGEWSDRLRRNQSTALYGRIDPATGVWTGPRGETVDDGK